MGGPGNRDCAGFQGRIGPRTGPLTFFPRKDNLARMKARSPDLCPVCGESVPPNSPACPECGADERAGWNENSAYLDGLDLPDTEEDMEQSYEAFMEREFGVGTWKKRFATVCGLILAVIMAVYLFNFF
jgi:hypothetical protein